MDPRQQWQATYPQRRPAYPQITATPSSSSSTSMFQSTSSLASLSTLSSANSVPQFLHMPQASAPLPSPSANPRVSYMGSMSEQPRMQHPTQQQRLSQQNPQQSTHAGQRGSGETPETAPFLQNFNLVAEAAKRAQMACLSRDLDEFGL